MRLLVISLVALLFLGVTGAAATPATRDHALEAYLDMRDATAVPAGWTGAVSGCVQGTESAASIAATLATVNRLRDFAGLGPVSFHADLNRKALAAALMMKAANGLSHTPGPGWPCYTEEGREGAGRSNLFLGLSGPAAMIGYVDDGGVDSLGHRRWLLDPRGAVYGTGSTGTTNALLVIGGAPSQAPVPELVAWPPPGFTPWPLVFADWSAAISSTGSIDLSRARVGVAIDGQPRSVSAVTVLQRGFGTGETLKWNVSVTDVDRTAQRTVAVTISNVVAAGVNRTFTYSFQAFPVLPPSPPAFAGTRTGSEVKVTWNAAAERGVPVTGYRVVGTDGGSSSQFDKMVGSDVRELTIPYVQPSRTLSLAVIPLSRAGSPTVTSQSIGPPATATPTPTPTPTPMPTATVPVDGSSDDPFARAPADLVVAPPSIRGRRLRVTATITSLANGDLMRLKIKARGRVAHQTARIALGRASFNVRLSRFHLRHRPLRVTVSYPGSAEVESDSDRWYFR